MNRRTILAALLALAASPAAAQSPAPPIAVEAPWARATLGNNRITAAYMVLRNTGGAADRLVAASSPVAGRVELHTMSMENDVMRMRQVQAIDVTAGSAATLRPGGLHIMLMDLREPLRAGAQIPLTLRFERAGTVEITMPVAAANATAAPGAAASPAAPMPMRH